MNRNVRVDFFTDTGVHFSTEYIEIPPYIGSPVNRIKESLLEHIEDRDIETGSIMYRFGGMTAVILETGTDLVPFPLMYTIPGG